MSRPGTILIVDDEPLIVEAVEAYLKKSGYETLTAFDGNEALSLFETGSPDMMILDLMLPGVSGEEICKAVRKKSRIPIIMLTAKAGEDNLIDGLNIGADDYMTKPFSPRELVARVNSLFRRISENTSPPNIMRWNGGDLEADFDAFTIKKRGEDISLTPYEFKLFSVLARNPNKTFTRDELIDYAYGDSFDGYDRTIDSHIKNLRAKIETDSSNPQYILTVRGVGYKWKSI